MRISCAQLSQIFDCPKDAFLQAEEFISRSDADLIVFPEQYATGWGVSRTPQDEAWVREQWLSLAEKYHKCLVGSFREENTSGMPYNTMLVCSPEGEVLSTYRKMHLFSPAGEDSCSSPGAAPSVFEFRGLKFGCAVCFDLRFPELFRSYLAAGCECVIVQAAWPAARISDWELLLRARAVENRGYVVGCNCLGFDAASGTDYCGRSMVCSPDGKILSDAGVFEGECVFDAEPDAVSAEVLELRKIWTGC